MKIRKAITKYSTMLQIARSISKDQINTRLILVIFVACWFFNKSTKTFHSVITYCNIKVTHKYKVVINVAIFITNKIQVIWMIRSFVFMRIVTAIEKPLSFL